MLTIWNIIEVLKKVEKLKSLELLNIKSNGNRKINLIEFPKTLKLNIFNCNYVSLKGVDKFEGDLSLDLKFKGKYQNLKTIQKCKGKIEYL